MSLGSTSDTVGSLPIANRREIRHGLPVIRVKHSIVVDRPLKEVFDYLTNPEKTPEWQESVIESTVITDGPIGLDTKVRVSRRFMGQSITLVLETTEFVPNERFSFKMDSGPVPLEGLVEVEPKEPGTNVTFTVSGDLGGLFSLTGPLIKQIVQSETVANGNRLKEILERDP